MNPREQFDGLVREFAGRIVGEVLRSTLEDVSPSPRTHLVNDPTDDGAPVEVSGPAPKAKVRHITLTPKRRAALKVQGRYLGLLRKFGGKERARIKAVAKSKGTAAATKAMEKALDARGKVR